MASYPLCPQQEIECSGDVKYRRRNLLGKGGFADCYRYSPIKGGQDVAAKVFIKSRTTREKDKLRMQREITIHKSVQHHNVVKFLESGEDGEVYFIMLELCNGNTLLNKVKKCQKLEESLVAFYLKQVINAVIYLHEQNIIHRDLKLGNLFLTDDNVVKVGDFGLACEIGDNKMQFSMCGTPNYMAPEIITKGGYSYEVDIWSIGVLMYVMLVGKTPFQGRYVGETYRNVLNCQFTLPFSMSSAAQHLIRQLLVKTPTDRPKLVEILAHEFFQESKE